MTGNAVLDALAIEARAAEIVVFRSRLTDVRGLRSWLERHRLPYREVEMAMGSSEERQRFHTLQEMTGWQPLPQVFVHGEFVGGDSELRVSPLALRPADATPADAREISPVIRTLGYTGLVPFVGGALGPWLGPQITCKLNRTPMDSP